MVVRISSEPSHRFTLTIDLGVGKQSCEHYQTRIWELVVEWRKIFLFLVLLLPQEKTGVENNELTPHASKNKRQATNPSQMTAHLDVLRRDSHIDLSVLGMSSLLTLQMAILSCRDQLGSSPHLIVRKTRARSVGARR